MSKAPKTVTAPVTPPEAPLSTDELKLLAHREKRAADKRAERQRKAEEKAAAATAPNPTGYVVPPMPAGLRGVRRWLRGVHDAYSKRLIGPLELTEVRRSASALGDTYKVGAIVRSSHAAMRQAEASDGGVAAALLVGLRNGDSTRYRPLAPRPDALAAPVAGSDGQ